MDEREQQRKARHRLAMICHAEEVTGNVAATCRYYGISRPCFYKWLRRYEEFGEEGLRDGSSAPLNSPRATKPEVVSKIIYLRQHYHFGPQKKGRKHSGRSPGDDHGARWWFIPTGAASFGARS